MAFYSLLGVSHHHERFYTQDVHDMMLLSTPFWEFQPTASSLDMNPCLINSLLSTPFWEFRQKVQ